MYRAEISLALFKYIGICPPTASKGITTLYNAFSLFVMSLMTLITASSLLYIFVKNTNMEVFFDNLLYSLGIFLDILKLAVFFNNRNEMFEITDLLLNEQYAPRDPVEICIQKRFDKIGRTGTIVYASFLVLAVSSKTIIPLIRDDFTSLPLIGWIPYSLESKRTFWLSVVFQSLGIAFAGVVVTASDTYIIVMLLQLCAQIEILIHRMEMSLKLYRTEFPNSSKKQQTFFVDWVQHHNSLYCFRYKLNDLFKNVFLCQLFVTTVEVCSGTYLLATFSLTSSKFWQLLLAMNFVMTEVYVFCLYGNLVMEKSKKIGYAVFSTDWTSLSRKSRKSLIFIIGRSNKPMKFTAGPNVLMSINTFTSVCIIIKSVIAETV